MTNQSFSSELRWVAMMFAAVMFCSSTLHAGKYNRDMDIGETAPTWTKLPGVDGKEHSLSDLKDKDVVVVAFTCNSCPYAEDYESRLIDFANRYCVAKSSLKKQQDETEASERQNSSQDKPRVALIAINVNKVEEDLLPAMKKRAEAKKFPYPYLFDETQQLPKEYGALWTPEFFVLNKERKVVYMGAFDDSTDASKVTKRYVESAVVATLEGKEFEVAETYAVGCRIRFERRRRSRRKPADTK